MIPTEAIYNIKDQLEAYERGEVTGIYCPWCGKINTPRTNFCCGFFREASVAALERIRIKQAAERMEQIMERHSKN